MIRINDDWVIDVDDRNYILKKDLHTDRKRKDGTTEHGWNIKGYFSSPGKALERFGEEIVRERLSVSNIGLSDAVRIIRESMEEYRKIIEGIEV